MKKYIVLTIFLLLASSFTIALSGCSKFKKEENLSDLEMIKKRGYLIVGVKVDSPPFGFYKDGKIVGIDVELAQNIANNIFKNNSPEHIQFVPVNAQNRIAKLNSKEVDILVATMSVNEKRKLIMDFSTPYFVANQKIMVKKNSKVSHLQYFNSSGRLAVVMGTTGEKISRLIAPNARFVGAKSYIEAFNLLLNNQVDAILGDDCILANFNNGDFKIVNRAYSREYYAVAIRKDENSKELLNSINAEITTLLDKKHINLIKAKYTI